MPQKTETKIRYDLLYDMEERISKVYRYTHTLMKEVQEMRRQAEEDLIEEMRARKSTEATNSEAA